MKCVKTARSTIRRARGVIDSDRYHTITQRYALILVMAASLVALAVPAIARTSHKSHRPTHGRCKMRRVARRLVADAQAVLYVRAEGGGGPEGFEPTETVGCAYRRGRVYSLGPANTGSECLDPGGCESLEHPVLAGPFAAFDYGQGGPEDHPFSVDVIRVVNLDNGRRVHNVPTGPSPTPEWRRGIGPATAIVLKSDGSVAWIAERADRLPPSPPEYEVRAVDRNGERLLASGTGVDPMSLALAGSTVHWTEAGRPMSAPLN